MYLLRKNHLTEHICKYFKKERIFSRRLSSNSPSVTVALSGGVDSSVSAYLLKKQGYNVTGIYMRNWNESEENYCSGTSDEEEVDRICHFLNIPYRVVHFEKEYWNNVFEPTVNIYESGLTPNPDILCNREIKFKRLTDYVFEKFKPDFIATGHYVRTRLNGDSAQLLTGLDPNKDQSYFLLEVNQEVLKKTLFPVGHLYKNEVREIASKAKLPNAERKESMGLCFIGKRKFDEFLNQYIDATPGNFIDIDTNKVVGQHKGICFYTIGQSTGISGMPQKSYIVKKDIPNNNIYICFGSEHPSLYSKSIEVSYIHWISGKPPERLLKDNKFECKVKIRYRQEAQSCTINYDDGKIMLNFDSMQKGATEGQYAGIYVGEVCLGGGPIKKVYREYEPPFLTGGSRLRNKNGLFS